MNNSEKLGLIERIDHASEDQAKRTLRSMILKCTVGQPTIARAIRDAIERHTPTPMIVYQQPESEDGAEAVLASSDQESNNSEKDQDGGSQDSDYVPSTTSKKHRSTRRGDINPDPLVGKHILKKTKTKLKRKKERSNDNKKGQNNPSSSKKNQSKHASKLRAEPEQRACDNSVGEPSQQKSPTIIDLLTSSEDETRDTQQSKNENLDDKSSDDNSADNDSPDDSSSDSDSSDDGGAEEEPQGNALADGPGPSQDASNKKAIQTSAGSSVGGRTTTRSNISSRAKAPNQKSGIEISLSGLGKKRKAPERTVEEVHNDQPVKSTMTAHLNKRSKQNHLQEPQRSTEDSRCRRCGILFPSVAQLLKHRDYCEGFAATLGSHHRSEPPSDDHIRRLKHIQTASHPADGSFTDGRHNTRRLPSRPRQTSPANRELSRPPPSFVHEPNNLPRGHTPMPLALAHSNSGIESSPSGLVHRPVSSRSSDGPPHRQSRRSKPESPTQRLLREVREKATHRCKDCKKQFWDFENSDRACRCHPGPFQPPHC